MTATGITMLSYVKQGEIDYAASGIQPGCAGADGALKGYSEMMGLYLCWDEGWPRFYDPATGTYLENWRQERARLQDRIAQLEAEPDLRRSR